MGGEKVNGFQQDAHGTGCEIGFPGLTAVFFPPINYAERPILSVNMEDPCGGYGKLRFISPLGGSIFFSLSIIQFFFLEHTIMK